MLDRSKLGRALSPNDVASAEEGIANHFPCEFEAFAAGVLADFNCVALEVADLSEKLEGRHAAEIVVSVFFQDIELGKILELPIYDGVVIFPGDRTR